MDNRVDFEGIVPAIDRIKEHVEAHSDQFESIPEGVAYHMAFLLMRINSTMKVWGKDYKNLGERITEIVNNYPNIE